MNVPERYRAVVTRFVSVDTDWRGITVQTQTIVGQKFRVKLSVGTLEEIKVP